MVSPSRRRATKRRRSSMTELAFHGIHTSRLQKAKSVTHVSGTNCHLCLGPLSDVIAPPPLSGGWPDLLVQSGFPESAGEAVEHRLHDVLEKRSLSGFDVNIGGHPRRRDKFRHALENVIFVQPHPNDIEVATRGVAIGAFFGLRLPLLRQSIR